MVQYKLDEIKQAEKGGFQLVNSSFECSTQSLKSQPTNICEKMKFKTILNYLHEWLKVTYQRFNQCNTTLFNANS